MVQQIEAFVSVAVALVGLFLFAHGMAMDGGHVSALAGLAMYLAVWAYGILRASYS